MNIQRCILDIEHFVKYCYKCKINILLDILYMWIQLIKYFVVGKTQFDNCQHIIPLSTMKNLQYSSNNKSSLNMYHKDLNTTNIQIYKKKSKIHLGISSDIYHLPITNLNDILCIELVYFCIKDTIYCRIMNIVDWPS